LLPIHRTDEDLPPLEQLREGSMLGAAPVEVGPHRDDYGRSVCCEGLRDRSEDRRLLDLVLTCGEDLFELVDRDDQSPMYVRSALDGFSEHRKRVLAGSDQRVAPPVAAGERTGLESVENSGAEQRRLPAPGCTDQREEPSFDQSRHSARDELLPPEVEVGVVRLESRETF